MEGRQDDVAEASWGVLLRLALIWLPAATAGWALFRALGPPGSDAGEIVLWSVAAATTVVLGTLAHLVLDRGPADPVQRWTAVAAVGFGIAISAGWTIEVNVGGPVIGLALGAAAAGARTGARPARVVPVVVAGGLGALVARLALGERFTTVGLAATLAATLVAGGIALVILDRRLPARPIAIVVVACGVAWVGAWFVTTRLLAPFSVLAALAAEIVLAVGTGGFVLGLVWRALTGESMAAVAIRWTAWGLAGFAGSLAVAWAVGSAGFGPGGPVALLDIGTAAAMPFAVWAAALPTIRRLTASADRARTS